MDGRTYRKLSFLDILVICEIILLAVIALLGVLSFKTGHSYEVTNQYGDIVRIYGYGIYAHDSFFMAPIFIGTDYAVFFLINPLLIITLIQNIRHRSVQTGIFLASVNAAVTYYAVSIAFGITYNYAHLLYIALFGISFYALILAMKEIELESLKNIYSLRIQTSGLSIFLVLSGAALFAAWLPDIIVSLVNGQSLELIEVYTTNITYVLDMGIISPFVFICLYMIKSRKSQGIVMLSILLTVCAIIGVMLPLQTLFQVLAGIELTAAAIITKVSTFVLLAFWALFFLIKLYRKMSEALQLL